MTDEEIAQFIDNVEEVMRTVPAERILKLKETN
jgi:hypothetical protein